MTISTKSPLDDTAHHDAGAHAPAGLRAWLIRFSEPHILFPVLTVLVLAVIWSSTFNLIKVERASAEVASIAWYPFL